MMPDLSSQLLEYTREFRTSIVDQTIEEAELAVGHNLCSTCFLFATRLPFGLCNSYKGSSTGLATADEQAENDTDSQASTQSTLEHESEATTTDPRIVVPEPSFKGCTWSLRECQITSSYCSICQHIVHVFTHWRSVQFDMGLSDCRVEDVVVQSHGSSYNPLYSQVEGFDDDGNWQIEDVSDLELFMPAITFSAPLPAPHLGVFGPQISFQPIESLDCTVHNFLKSKADPETMATCEFKNYFGCLRPQIVCFSLLELWKTDCIEMHGQACSAPLVDQDPIDQIRLIDVNLKCLIDRPGNIDYVALSYVWGAGNTVRLLKSNIKSYYQPGSLANNNAQLPATIADAITATICVGEMYLWVDSLCIVQDDDRDKGRFLSVMDLIYAHAKLTIVSVAGTDARDGLHGVRPHTRSPPQIPFQGTGKNLIVQSLQPPGNGFTLNYAGESKWNTRAWTLQERVFSRRALIFTAEQVYWECQTATWREDATWENVHPPLFRETGVLDEIEIHKINEQAKDDSITFDVSFRRLVQLYSKRNLTVLSDRLHAFEGILKVLSCAFGERFHWGLPTRYFVDALCWLGYENDSGEDATRVDGHHLLPDSLGSSSLKVPLPSWSWVGWKCYVPWQECGNVLVERDDIGLRMFFIAQNDAIEEITVEDPQRQSLAYLGGVRTVEKHDIPVWLFSDPKRHTALHFWTVVTTVEIKYETVSRESESIKSMVLWQNNTRIEIVRQIHSAQLKGAQSNTVGALLISKVTRSYHDGLALLAIMLVTWQDGIAYRLGMVELKENDWLSLTEKEWKAVSLC